MLELFLFSEPVPRPNGSRLCFVCLLRRNEVILRKRAKVNTTFEKPQSQQTKATSAFVIKAGKWEKGESYCDMPVCEHGRQRDRSSE